MRWIIRIVAVLALLAVVAIGALIAVPSERIAEIAADRLNSVTGRNVEFRGGIRPQIVPALGIRAENVVIGNPDWVEEGPMLVADAMEMRVAWAGLLTGGVQIRAAELEAPRIVLVRDSDGQVSWDFGGSAPVAEAGSGTAETTPPPLAATRPSRQLGVDRASIRDGELLFIDEMTGQSYQFTDVRADIVAPAAGGAARIDLSLDGGAGPVTIALETDDTEALMAGAVSAVTLAIDWDGGSVGFDGRAGTGPALDGALSLEAVDLTPVFVLAGLAPPELPEGLGRDRIAVSGDVTYTAEASLHLRGVDVTLDENSLQTELDLLPGADRPLLRGNVTAGVLTIGGEDSAPGETSAEAPGAETGSAAAPTGWSEAPIDASGLFALDAEMSVTAEQITAAGVVLDLVAARLENESGRAVLDLTHAGLFGGTVTGSIVANGRNTFSTSVALDIVDIDLNPATLALSGWDRLEGRGGATFSVVAQGASMDALMNDLDGEGAIDFGQGAILGLDIAGMIRNFDAGFRGEGQRTVFDALTATFTINDGVLQNDDLNLSAGWGGVTGEGRVDLGGQSMDYLVTPGVLGGGDGARLAVPVRVEGPWSDLRYRPDLNALAEQELAEELEELEDRTTDALRNLVNDELGTDIEDGASREDAIDQLEEAVGDRVREGLQNLFD